MMLETTYYFKEGDRVQTRRTRLGVAAGTVGTVEQVYVSTSGVYEVRFDGYKESMIAYDEDLQLVKPVERIRCR